MCAQPSNRPGTSALGAALAYAQVGWLVLPLKQGGKAPIGQLVPNGWHDATTAPDTIRRWCERAPDMNIGIACALSGLAVVDIDPRHGGDDQFHDLERELCPLPDTPRSLTGGGGGHVALKDPGVPLVGRLAPGVEIKSVGYIVAPPSVTTGRYEWEISPFDTPLAPVPAAWLARMMKTPAASPTLPPRPPASGDVLRDLLPAEYVKDIAGLDVPRSGMVSCPSPSHPDRTPSLRVYATAEDGWYCFGCGRGGSILDFWALTIGYDGALRGPVYLRAEQQLLDFYMNLWRAAA